MDISFPRKIRRTTFILCACILVVSFFYYFFLSAPSGFRFGNLVHIERKSSLSVVAKNLKAEHVIRSEFFFKVFTVLFNKKHQIVEGDYFFDEPVAVFSVAHRMVKGDYGMKPTRITIPEGSTAEDVATLITRKISDFDTAGFTKIASEHEGYLFPDTYFFFQNVTPDRVIDAMTINFKDKIKVIEPNIEAFKKPLKDIVTMASIIEEEANTQESRRIISGILWKRIEEGIPLQVDSSFIAINGKKSLDLTLKDLAIDSPYNTYKHTGLPIGPISNPGIDALLAAVSPIETDYYYFLSDSRGNMYYAKTFAEHLKNKEKYINR